MPFIEKIAQYRSLSIVGMQKNTGKTESLNYILGHLPSSLKIAVTSIGIDGERVDQVTNTAKPEIFLRKGIFFGTSEKYYRTRALVSEVHDVTPERTSLGRVVTAEVVCGGKVLLSGPSSASSLERWSRSLDSYGIDLKIVDGALSRLSSASPAISEAMILTTGAALSANMNTLISNTSFTVELAMLPEVEDEVRKSFAECDSGIWISDSDGRTYMLDMPSSFSTDALDGKDMSDVRYVYVTGALTDRFLNKLRLVLKNSTLIVKDFTRFFVTRQCYSAFLRAGNDIKVMKRTELLAICANPVSPAGFTLDSDRMVSLLREKTGVPVYDLRRL